MIRDSAQDPKRVACIVLISRGQHMTSRVITWNYQLQNADLDSLHLTLNNTFVLRKRFFKARTGQALTLMLIAKGKLAPRHSPTLVFLWQPEYIVCLLYPTLFRGDCLHKQRCIVLEWGQIYHFKRHTCSSRHSQPQPLFLTGIIKRQLHQQRSRPERGRWERLQGEKEGRCTENRGCI